jgi:hypothetical protein
MVIPSFQDLVIVAALGAAGDGLVVRALEGTSADADGG